MNHAAMALLAALALGGAAHAQQPRAEEAGDAARGHDLFMSDGCYECHGTAGQGGVGLRLAPAPLPVVVIRAYLRNPAGEMPPYTSAVVSDRDVRDIHAFLASIPAPPDPKTIPELRLGERR